MDRAIRIFIIFLFGVMAGYAWNWHHQGIKFKVLQAEIADNSKEIQRLMYTVSDLNKDLIIEQTIEKIAMCESGYNSHAEGDNGKSYGVAQFHLATFEWLKDKANQPDLKWKSSDHQIKLLRWALQNGYERYWVCR